MFFFGGGVSVPFVVQQTLAASRPSAASNQRGTGQPPPLCMADPPAAVGNPGEGFPRSDSPDHRAVEGDDEEGYTRSPPRNHTNKFMEQREPFGTPWF